MNRRKITSAADVKSVVAGKHLPAATSSDMSDDDFWTSRPILHHIRTAARASLTGPWAVLGVCLVDVVAATAPEVQLPGYVGGPASLNLFAGLVGPPGGGKGGATACARRALTIVGPNGHNARAPQFPLGTGEGLVRIFAGDGGGDDDAPPPTRAVIDVPEIDMLEAQKGRQGSTLMPVLRQSWMGETLGFTNSERARRTALEAHSYRLCLIAGVQPLRAGVLLDDAAGGTPQRFMWMRVDDPAAPRHTEPSPGVEVVRLPEIPAGGCEMGMPETVAKAVRAARLESLHGGLERQNLDGHALLAREKIAAALALLDGRLDATDEDWRLAGHVMAVSDATRAEVQRIRNTSDRRSRHQRAEHRGEDSEVAATARLRTRAEGHVHRWITRNADGQWHTSGDIAQSGKSDIREHLPDAIAAAVRAGRLETGKHNGHVVYRVTVP